MWDLEGKSRVAQESLLCEGHHHQCCDRQVQRYLAGYIQRALTLLHSTSSILLAVDPVNPTVARATTRHLTVEIQKQQLIRDNICLKACMQASSWRSNLVAGSVCFLRLIDFLMIKLSFLTFTSTPPPTAM